MLLYTDANFHLENRVADFAPQKKHLGHSVEQLDPFAARFIQDQLGNEKWSIFTSRLAENRKNGSRAKLKVALTAAMESGSTDFGDFGDGASAIDFLVKVEVVKSVLRSFVPYVFLTR